jgi:hypothetical protein
MHYHFMPKSGFQQTESSNMNRTAYRIVRELTHILSAVPRDALPHVARGLADAYNLPRKAMLKVMRRYVRLYRA